MHEESSQPLLGASRRVDIIRASNKFTFVDGRDQPRRQRLVIRESHPIGHPCTVAAFFLALLSAMISNVFDASDADKHFRDM